MRSAAVLMESAFKDHKETVENTKDFVKHAVLEAEKQYGDACNDYIRVMDSNNALQDEINQIKAKQKQPLKPDTIFN